MEPLASYAGLAALAGTSFAMVNKALDLALRAWDRRNGRCGDGFRPDDRLLLQQAHQTTGEVLRTLDRLTERTDALLAAVREQTDVLRRALG